MVWGFEFGIFASLGGAGPRTFRIEEDWNLSSLFLGDSLFSMLSRFLVTGLSLSSRKRKAGSVPNYLSAALLSLVCGKKPKTDFRSTTWRSL